MFVAGNRQMQNVDQKFWFTVLKKRLFFVTMENNKGENKYNFYI